MSKTKPLSDKALTQTISKLYKQESSRLLGVLTRIFGTHNFSLAEDVLQDAFAKAWHEWQDKGIPANPAAWLLTTAKHQAIDVIRNQKMKIKFADDLAYHLESEWTLGATIEDAFQAPKIKDDQLRMLFMCCHESIKPENGIPFMLKALCGFSIPAIARALVVPEETIKKRLQRTRKKISTLSFAMPKAHELHQALATVHTVLYLLFNEGFHCSSDKQSVRLEFCQDAIALVKLLVDEPSIANQETLGLFALMHFHIARIDSKLSHDGQNIPIDLQDRKLWTQAYIQTGNQLISYANKLTPHNQGRFYLEACIAQEHCNATSFEATDWENIITLYDKLIATNDSPIAKLNQSIAVAYAGDTNKAIAQAKALQQNNLLKKSHMPWAVLAHLHAKNNNTEEAYRCLEKAKALGGTPQEQLLMLQQVERILQGKTIAKRQ